MDDNMTSYLSRQRLVEAAAQAFLTHGYAAARLDLIARDAGISKKTIYKYVDSKVELFALAVEDRVRRAGIPDLLLDPDASEEPRAALRRSLIAIAAVALSPEGLAAYRLVAREGAAFPELVAAHDRPIAPLVENLTAWLAAQTNRGWLALASPGRAALMLLDMVLAYERRVAQFGLPPPDAAAQARRVDEALEIFLDGAVARGGA
jgi:AcrR family transcriptional regulator